MVITQLNVVLFTFARINITTVSCQGNGENYIMRSLMICTPYRILCGW